MAYIATILYGVGGGVAFLVLLNLFSVDQIATMVFFPGFNLLFRAYDPFVFSTTLAIHILLVSFLIPLHIPY